MTTIIAQPQQHSPKVWKREAFNFVEETGVRTPALVFNIADGAQPSTNSSFTIAYERPLPEPEWLKPTLQAIAAMPFNSDTWGLGARRTDPSAVGQLLNVLALLLPGHAPTPAIVPTWVGGVQAEWHRNGVDLEISVNPGGPVEYYCSNGDDEREGIARDDWAMLKEYIKAMA